MYSPSNDDDSGYSYGKKQQQQQRRRQQQQQQQHKPQDLKFYDFGQFRILFGVLENLPLHASF
jgi:hypothetical protein